MKRIIIFLFIALPLISLTQDKKKFGIKFHGFVKTDIFFDTRQTVDAREGHFLLYPKNEDLDALGTDINAASKFNILAIQTRIKGVITGPDIWGAKTSGLIEGAFFGNIGTDINGFRLRHAFVKLAWPKTELLIGQYWHPMFVTGCFPGTVSFNTGAPFEPFARNPQVRFTKKFGKVNLIATALEQVDFVSAGPYGASRKYLINSAMPEFDLRLEYKSEKFYAGAGANYKRLKPLLSIRTIGTNETISLKAKDYASGMSYYGFVKIAPKPVTIKLYGIYGQMLYSMTMLGGYAVSGVDSTLVSGEYAYSGFDYTPINTLSFWLDFNTNGKKLKVGLFAGYSKNLGTSDKEYDFPDGDRIYARGANIAYAYRIAPRLIYNIGKFRIAPELEYTVAAYAVKDSTTDEFGVISNPKEIGNFRVLLGAYFFF